MKFPEIIFALQEHYGSPTPPSIRDPFSLIVWENIGYLVDDTRRRKAFDQLKEEVGLEPTALMAAPIQTLTRITKIGGILEGLRAQRLKEIAQITLNEFGGDLSSILKLPLPKAIKALKLFPSLSDPGAEKTLLFTNAYPILPLDSNGQRVLLRLGFGEEKKSYTASYKSVRAALKDECGSDWEFLITAYQLLKQHGQELCKRNNPRCELCPLRKTCTYYLIRSNADS